jgi:putative FmdB family regulatory protein
VPIYEFRCTECDQIFERLLTFDADEPACPSCGGDDVRRLISLIGGLGGLGGSESARPVAMGGCGGCGGGACACAN